MLSAKKYFSAVGCLTCKEKKENTSKCKYIQKFHYLCHCVLKPWFVHPKIIFTIIISDLPFKVKYSFDHCTATPITNELFCQLFRALRYQWITEGPRLMHIFGLGKKPCYLKFVLVGLYCGPLLMLIPPLTRVSCNKVFFQVSKCA